MKRRSPFHPRARGSVLILALWALLLLSAAIFAWVKIINLEPHRHRRP